MTQPSNQPDKEQEGLTREFNFPKPWIKDYNPQIHGIKPGMDFQQGAAPAPGPAQPPAVQPGAVPGQAPSQYQVAPPPLAQQGYPQSAPPSTGPVQWNPTGVYGGDAPKEKGIPPWVWTLISAAVLIIVLLLLFFVVLK
ncbi:MAG: hypothetical protein J0I20_27965 [Chloroflexi bacterium]|nr:hypothetical protein [Chloroflexota bacterium]OJV97529.1 MAG: hypothetical protein BGO39_07100 [Chloroflexi bacterium 54-19]